MATQSNSMLLEEAAFGSAFNPALHSCPDMLSSIYTAHYSHVLQVCRRFFRRPEDAEDAAAEVFLKLHTVLDKKDEEHPFRPGFARSPDAIASTSSAAASAKSARSSPAPIFVWFPTPSRPRLFPKFCAKRPSARFANNSIFFPTTTKFRSSSATTSA